MSTDPYKLMVHANFKQALITLTPKCTYDGHAVDSPPAFDLEIVEPCASSYSIYKNSKNDDLKKKGFEMDYMRLGTSYPYTMSIKALEYFDKDSGFTAPNECTISPCNWHWADGKAKKGFTMNKDVLYVNGKEVYDDGMPSGE